MARVPYIDGMDMENREILLEGGNLNTVVKIGNTVRRQVTPQSNTVHEFLRHLERKNIATPRFLGIDKQGREILSFIEGEADFPDTLWKSEHWLIATAQLLKEFHDASIDFPNLKVRNWAFEYPDSGKHEVISHNDFAPYNMIFHLDNAVSVIDCDLCGPGPRSWDLAYLAYWMAPFSFGSGALNENTDKNLRSNCKRLNVLCQAYGFEHPIKLIGVISEVLHHMSNEKVITKMVGKTTAAHLKSGGHFKHWAEEAKTFDEKRREIEKLLSENIRV